jgi:predicted nucleic acid-binding protein
MIVVSDTSPLNYLILIELHDLLPKLFDRILIPEAVHRELQSAAAPDPIKRFLVAGVDTPFFTTR